LGTEVTVPDLPYHLGCPVWACQHWIGSLFTRRAGRVRWLGEYSTVFNTVEGNSVFYALPRLETVKRWVESSHEGFRFALKFPRVISHEHRLLDAEAETEAFLDILGVLDYAGRLGPSFLQLPRGFSGYHLDDLGNYLRQLPRHFPFAVEVRHRDFFGETAWESELNALLLELRVDRVIFDSRPLFSVEPSDEFELKSQQRKPQLPVHDTVTARHPMIRFVACNDLRRAIPWIREWAPTVASWIRSGLTPYVFTHTPDDQYAPFLAKMFHEELMKHQHSVPALADWPGEHEKAQGRQLELF
jgi:uncharacterized protein YecE (DUF72 family)